MISINCRASTTSRNQKTGPGTPTYWRKRFPQGSAHSMRWCSPTTTRGRCGRPGRPVVPDPKKTDLSVYTGATVLMPDILETERAIGRRFDDENDLRGTAAALRADHRLGTMLITRPLRPRSRRSSKTKSNGVFGRHRPAAWRTRSIVRVVLSPGDKRKDHDPGLTCQARGQHEFCPLNTTRPEAEWTRST